MVRGNAARRAGCPTGLVMHRPGRFMSGLRDRRLATPLSHTGKSRAKCAGTRKGGPLARQALTPWPGASLALGSCRPGSHNGNLGAMKAPVQRRISLFRLLRAPGTPPRRPLLTITSRTRCLGGPLHLRLAGASGVPGRRVGIVKDVRNSSRAKRRASGGFARCWTATRIGHAQGTACFHTPLM